jgi:histidinol-phosphate aminotransferase
MSKAKLNVQEMIRPCCAGFQPYVAGKPIATIKRELGLSRVIKLASNENPLGPSPRALDAVRKAVSDIYFYPDANSWCLRQALAKKFRLAAENILLGAGSDELIELIAKVFFRPTDEVVVSEHSFIRYRMAGDLMGCTVVAAPMKNYTHDLEAMAAAVTPRTKAIFITNPNNPTGTYNTDAEFRKFLATVRKKCGKRLPLVIMDEAYYEYARVQKDYPETLDYLPKYPGLIILRTFSKVYALAGIRVGYGFAAPGIVDYIDRIRPPFNINSLAQAAAVASLADRAQVTKGVALVQEGKRYLARELKRLNVPFVPSAANFLLIDVGPAAGQAIFKRLLKRGVIVRAMDEYEYPQFVRVTIGLPAENRLFIQELEKALKEERPQ